MALMTWKDAFKCGNPSVDHEHEVLINLINEMHGKAGADCSPDSAKDTIKQYLGEIHALIEAHFALEEKIMRDIGFKGYAAHKENHEKLLDEIRDIMEGVTEDSSADYEKDLTKSMNRWFGVHFATYDRDFHAAYPG